MDGLTEEQVILADRGRKSTALGPAGIRGTPDSRRRGCAVASVEYMSRQRRENRIR